MNPTIFPGDVRARVKEFPAPVRSDVGQQIYRLQIGLEPTDWKPLKIIGPGVREIRIRDVSGAYRVIYLAGLAEAVYVLHAFQKKSQATPKRDLEIAARRYAEIMRK
jgi:phage-related protein